MACALWMFPDILVKPSFFTISHTTKLYSKSSAKPSKSGLWFGSTWTLECFGFSSFGPEQNPECQGASRAGNFPLFPQALWTWSALSSCLSSSVSMLCFKLQTLAAKKGCPGELGEYVGVWHAMLEAKEVNSSYLTGPSPAHKPSQCLLFLFLPYLLFTVNVLGFLYSIKYVFHRT